MEQDWRGHLSMCSGRCGRAQERRGVVGEGFYDDSLVAWYGEAGQPGHTVTRGTLGGRLRALCDHGRLAPRILLQLVLLDAVVGPVAERGDVPQRVGVWMGRRGEQVQVEGAQQGGGGLAAGGGGAAV